MAALIGPGQWQAFQIEAGAFDLLEITISRDEFDNATYPYPWADGFNCHAWLSRYVPVRVAVYATA